MNDPQEFISNQMFENINNRLSIIEQDEQIRILFAVESGSRAWGFPSPNSDYDVRFIYIRPADWYLSIFPGRDVIECPIDNVYDINGWDIRKALQLAVKPNPVLLEWLRSPIVYRASPGIIDKISEFTDQVVHFIPSTYHYLNLAESQYRRFIYGKQTIKLKKYFYIIRPVCALIWLRNNPGMPVPMNLAQLRKGITLPNGIESIFDELLAKKLQTDEIGETAPIKLLDNFVENEIAEVKSQISFTKKSITEDFAESASDLFRSILATHSPNYTSR